jgi:succinyl-diaminopimelate desuccinylase
MDVQVLCERLIAADTSTADGLHRAAGFVKGWLETSDIEVVEHEFAGLPVLVAAVGPPERDAVATVALHGHLDVVPAHPEQFVPRVDGDRLFGRGAYDMKGGLAAMMYALRDVAGQDRVRVLLVCVPDEEAGEVERHAIDWLLNDRGLRADFAITGEPTDLHVGVQAKGVLALRAVVSGVAAHGSTPWLGDNAILKAHDAFRRIESLPFSRQSTELFDRPSINLARISGGDAINKVPDSCTIDVDIRYLPGQDPEQILAEISGIEDLEIVRSFTWPPAVVSPVNPYVVALRAAVSRVSPESQALTVGRDGASDAVAFLEAGIPAVEFGPIGGGHHGPSEWVSLSSLARYRQALGAFVATLPERLEAAEAVEEDLRAAEGGLA